jgi:hypothetical protein
VAVTASVLTEGSSTTDAASYATASISPTANRLVLLAVFSGDTVAAAAAAPSSVTGNGLTWVQVATQNNSDSNTNITTTVFRAMGASPSAGAVTINFGATQENCAWSVAEFAGVPTTGTHGSGAVVQAKTATHNNGSAWSVTLDVAPGAANALYGAAQQNSNTVVITPGAGFTQLGTSQSIAGPAQETLVEWDASAPVDGIIDGTSDGVASINVVGVEIAALTAQTVTPSSIASAEAFGTPTLVTAQTVAPTGVPSAEAFGTLTLTVTTPIRTRLFIPPVVADTPWVNTETPRLARRLFRHYGPLDRGRSVIKVGGSYRTVDSPDQLTLAAATEVYLGGHEYIVSEEVGNALLAAGYSLTDLFIGTEGGDTLLAESGDTLEV